MHYLLFTTTRCPKCPDFKNFVAEKISFKGECLNEQHSDFQRLAAKFGVTMAPSILIFSDQNERLLCTSETHELETFLTQF